MYIPTRTKASSGMEVCAISSGNGKEKEMDPLRITVITPDNLYNRKAKRKNYLAGVMTAIYCSLVSATPVFASSDSVVQGITKGTEEVWKLLIGIVAPIAAVALALQVIKIIWGGQRAAEEAKSAAIKIVVAIAVVLMAPAIISAVRGWFQQASWSFG